MKLDVKDTKILQQLDSNPTITTSALAKKIRLSQQVVDYRIKRLADKGIIVHVGTTINLAKIGYAQYRVFFTFDNIPEPEKQQIMNDLKKHSQVYWAAIIGNKWDLLVVVFVRSYNDFERFLDQMFRTYALRDYEALYVLFHEYYGHSYLNSTLPPIVLDYSQEENILQLDKTDVCILHHIKNNARLPSLEVGKHCNVTYKTVQYRKKRLQEQGVILGPRLFLSSSSLGYKAFLILVSFSSYGRKMEKKLIAHASELPEVTQSIKVFGRWSLQLHVRVKEYQELQNIIIQLRNTYPHLDECEVIPIFQDIIIDHFPMSK